MVRNENHHPFGVVYVITVKSLTFQFESQRSVRQPMLFWEFARSCEVVGIFGPLNLDFHRYVVDCEENAKPGTQRSACLLSWYPFIYRSDTTTA